MWRYSHTLTKSALEVTIADARKRGQVAQLYGLSECVFYVLENQLEPAARKAPDGPRRSCLQGRIVVNQMVREEFTSTLGIQPSCWRSVRSFARKI